MNWTIKYDSGFDFFKVIFEGESSLDESIRAKQEYITHEHWRPGMNILVDLSRTILLSPEVSELRRNAQFNSNNEEKFGHGRIAYLVDSRRDFGVARQIQTFMEMYTKHETMIFMNENEAILWLISKPSPRIISINNLISKTHD